MTTIKTFFVVRNGDGTIDALSANVTVEFTDGKGMSVAGLAPILMRESMLRTIKALSATGFYFPMKRLIVTYTTDSGLFDDKITAELLDLPLAVAIMVEREFAVFDTDVRYIGKLCPDGRIDELDGNVIRACRAKWPPNFVSSLTYPDGKVRPNPGHTYLSTIKRDFELVEHVGIVVRKNANDGDGGVQTRQTVYQLQTRQTGTTKTGSPNEADGDAE